MEKLSFSSYYLLDVLGNYITMALVLYNGSGVSFAPLPIHSFQCMDLNDKIASILGKNPVHQLMHLVVYKIGMVFYLSDKQLINLLLN